jgi:hypothetical protein
MKKNIDDSRQLGVVVDQIITPFYDEEETCST